MPSHDSRNTQNHILSALSQADFRLLEQHLAQVDLPLRMKLEPRNRAVEHVYFLEAGLASIVANGDRNVEVGMVGREGMTGMSIVMGSDGRPRNETFMQVAGYGLRIASSDLRQAIHSSTALHHALLRFAHTFLVQTAETALANGRSKIEERLARWLLLCHDRIDGDELPLTHEFLATMLGARRSGVTVALNELERQGFVSHQRGVVSIRDREGLMSTCNGTYDEPTTPPGTVKI